MLCGGGSAETRKVGRHPCSEKFPGKALRVKKSAYRVVKEFKISFMSSDSHQSDATSRCPAVMRKAQRITITLSWSLYQRLVEESNLQGRSISSMACFWLERYQAAYSDEHVT